MDWILPIAGIIAAAAFLILYIDIIVVLSSVKENLDYVTETLDGIEGQVRGIIRETTDLLHKVNRLTEDVQGEVGRLNSVVGTAKGIGDSVQTLNSSIDRIADSITRDISQGEDRTSQVVQWSNVTVEITDRWRNRHCRRGSANYRANNVTTDANHDHTSRVDK